jgi:hypothetical protein
MSSHDPHAGMAERGGSAGAIVLPHGGFDLTFWISKLWSGRPGTISRWPPLQAGPLAIAATKFACTVAALPIEILVAPWHEI